jgi:uronate dehydrogenase
MTVSNLLVTGAAGGVGRELRQRLTGKYKLVRYSDIAAMAPAAAGEETVIADLSDAVAIAKLCEGMDAIVHLGGQSVEGRWSQVIAANLIGLINVYEGARLAGVKRILFASSNHAIGFHRRSEQLDHTSPARPDSRYGLSKAFGEDMARFYADKYDIKGFSIRIGSCFPKPVNARMLSTWMSYDDLARLVEVGLKADYHNEIVYGVSRNTRSWWDNSNAYRLGFDPQDNAEVYAAEVGHIISDDHVEEAFQGGGYTSPEFVGTIDRVP